MSNDNKLSNGFQVVLTKVFQKKSSLFFCLFTICLFTIGDVFFVKAKSKQKEGDFKSTFKEMLQNVNAIKNLESGKFVVKAPLFFEEFITFLNKSKSTDSTPDLSYTGSQLKLSYRRHGVHVLENYKESQTKIANFFKKRGFKDTTNKKQKNKKAPWEQTTSKEYQYKSGKTIITVTVGVYPITGGRGGFRSQVDSSWEVTHPWKSHIIKLSEVLAVYPSPNLPKKDQDLFDFFENSPTAGYYTRIEVWQHGAYNSWGGVFPVTLRPQIRKILESKFFRISGKYNISEDSVQTIFWRSSDATQVDLITLKNKKMFRFEYDAPKSKKENPAMDHLRVLLDIEKAKFDHEEHRQFLLTIQQLANENKKKEWEVVPFGGFSDYIYMGLWCSHKESLDITRDSGDSRYFSTIPKNQDIQSYRLIAETGSKVEAISKVIFKADYSPKNTEWGCHIVINSKFKKSGKKTVENVYCNSYFKRRKPQHSTYQGRYNLKHLTHYFTMKKTFQDIQYTFLVKKNMGFPSDWEELKWLSFESPEAFRDYGNKKFDELLQLVETKIKNGSGYTAQKKVVLPPQKKGFQKVLYIPNFPNTVHQKNQPRTVMVKSNRKLTAVEIKEILSAAKIKIKKDRKVFNNNYKGMHIAIAKVFPLQKLYNKLNLAVNQNH
ncbi:hypothetical protein MNBD_PLANCTO02-100 [hydrothermal vent metagenome]|uniref:Uncharacterized protein n=1 Tax=hydrothermal vent metagenome TaxID=652676 RepID=A0A3B1DP10_9ZZZZ